MHPYILRSATVATLRHSRGVYVTMVEEDIMDAYPPSRYGISDLYQRDCS